MGTPALAFSRLIVPTQFADLVALDAATGAEQWRHSATTSRIHPVHYQATGESFSSAPIVTGDIVWAGASDGVLYAVDLVNGDSLWSLDLHAPILSAPIASDRLLFVATWDGTVRSLVSDIDPIIPPIPGPPTQGCGCAVGARSPPSLGVFALVVLLAFALARVRWRAIRSTRR
ncbi:MAG: PQQ-binding-like beta-propeller repeat protein [Actinomycetota bacterium]